MTTVWSGRSGPILGVVLILALTACQGLPRLPFGAPTQPAQPALYTISTPFNEAEFAPYGSDGRSSISGEAYVRVPGGISLAAGSEVVLVPTAQRAALTPPPRHATPIPLSQRHRHPNPFTLTLPPQHAALILLRRPQSPN